jgi:hypothetical protein
VSAVRLLFDEDFNGRIIRGVRRRAIDEIVLIGEASAVEEWLGLNAYLPLT